VRGVCADHHRGDGRRSRRAPRNEPPARKNHSPKSANARVVTVKSPSWQQRYIKKTCGHHLTQGTPNTLVRLSRSILTISIKGVFLVF